MNIEQLAREAALAIRAGLGCHLVLPKNWKAPRGFPRGELLCVNSREERVVSFNPKRLLKWIEANQ